MAALRLTFGDVTDLVFKVRPTTAPGHVFQVEALIRAQHDHLNGAGLEQSNLVLCSQLPARKDTTHYVIEPQIVNYLKRHYAVLEKKLKLTKLFSKNNKVARTLFEAPPNINKVKQYE